jgi:SAM-dependent methyltransferase
MEERNRVQWIYASRDNKELAERYDEWAKDYDSDLEQDFEYSAPRLGAKYFARYVPKDARILDAGAGTGLVGVELSKLGYSGEIMAMDLSEGMLEESRKTGVYKRFDRMVMGEHLDYPTDYFDATISIGVLSLGHAPANSFDELIRVTRPGGHILFTLRPDVYEGFGFKEKQMDLEASGKWKLVEVSEKTRVLPLGEPDIFHQFWVYRVTS